jgi:hypothetical protein
MADPGVGKHILAEAGDRTSTGGRYILLTVHRALEGLQARIAELEPKARAFDKLRAEVTGGQKPKWWPRRLGNSVAWDALRRRFHTALAEAQKEQT